VTTEVQIATNPKPAGETVGNINGVIVGGKVRLKIDLTCLTRK
jgi:hypothetical protein